MIKVVIPAYKAEERLPRVIAAVEAQNVAIEIFIRDNSTDNVYYTAPVNEGLLRFMGSSEYILVLSDDVYLRDGCLAALIRGMEANPRAGIVSPIQFGSGGKCVWS